MLLSRADLCELADSFDQQIIAHFPEHTLDNWRTCAYCQSLTSLLMQVEHIIRHMPARMEVWIS